MKKGAKRGEHYVLLMIGFVVLAAGPGLAGGGADCPAVPANRPLGCVRGHAVVSMATHVAAVGGDPLDARVGGGQSQD
jgi:hypothetical protein